MHTFLNASVIGSVVVTEVVYFDFAFGSDCYTAMCGLYMWCCQSTFLLNVADVKCLSFNNLNGRKMEVITPG